MKGPRVALGLLLAVAVVAAPCCDLHHTPLSEWGSCELFCITNVQPGHQPVCMPAGQLGATRAMKLAGHDPALRCVYLSGFPKSGTSFGALVGAQVLRLACEESQKCLTFEAEWPGVGAMQEWQPATYNLVQGAWSIAGYDPTNHHRARGPTGAHWDGYVVAAAMLWPPGKAPPTKPLQVQAADLPLPPHTNWDPREPQPPTIVHFTQSVTKHVPLIDAVADLHVVMPVRDPRMLVMSMFNWRVWKFGPSSMEAPDEKGRLRYALGALDNAAQHVNTLLARVAERRHRGQVLVYRHSAMIENPNAVAAQIADMLGVRRLDAKFDVLVARVVARLPEALQVEVAANNTKSRLGKVQYSSAAEEARGLCEWVGPKAVTAMDANLHQRDADNRKYVAAMFPQATRCRGSSAGGS